MFSLLLMTLTAAPADLHKVAAEAVSRPRAVVRVNAGRGFAAVNVGRVGGRAFRTGAIRHRFAFRHFHNVGFVGAGYGLGYAAGVTGYAAPAVASYAAPVVADAAPCAGATYAAAPVYAAPAYAYAAPVFAVQAYAAPVFSYGYGFRSFAFHRGFGFRHH